MMISIVLFCGLSLMSSILSYTFVSVSGINILCLFTLVARKMPWCPSDSPYLYPCFFIVKYVSLSVCCLCSLFLVCLQIYLLRLLTRWLFSSPSSAITLSYLGCISFGRDTGFPFSIFSKQPFTLSTKRI